MRLRVSSGSATTPSRRRSSCGGACSFFKIIQGSVFAFWWFTQVARRSTNPLDWVPADMTVMLVVLCVALMSFGQLLNFLTFKQLEVVGVMYGAQYGHKVRWVTEFPYSVMNDPQYMGVVIFVWGVFGLAANAVTDWWVIPAMETVLYYSSMWFLEA